MNLAVRSFLRVFALALLCLPTGHALAQAPAAPIPSVLIDGPPSIRHFFANPVFSGAILSPNAKFLAVRFGSDKERDRLAVVDLVNNTVKVVAVATDGDVASFEWVNDKRLVFTTADKRLAPGASLRLRPGLFGVDRDGGQVLPLIATGLVTTRRVLSWDHTLAFPAGKQDTDEIYAYRSNKFSNEKRNHLGLVRLNTRTGQSFSLDRPGASFEWLADHAGVPRLTSVKDKNLTSIVYLDPATRKFRTLGSFDAYVGSPAAFSPLAFGPDNTLYVTANGGKDKQALHTFDLKTNTLNPTPLVALADFDFKGELVFTDDKLLGVRYLSDANATIWFDDAMKSVQAQVDAQLPDTVNLVSVARRAEMPWVLVNSYSDRQPSQYALFNTKTGKLNPVGEARPQIKPAQMAGQEIVRIKARDGLTIPVWMTVPNGVRKDLPMVVMVHGGPDVRGHEWGWASNAQFLASRGYVVLEPEFRGSKGYGDRHYKAGWKQWGLAMQNDVADATRWAIAEGIADPQRICIAGASYGGYASLMGLVNDPDLYKCGIDIVGVTDLTLQNTNGNCKYSLMDLINDPDMNRCGIDIAGQDWSFDGDASEGYRKYGMPSLIGDPVKDAARFNATSPLSQATRIKQPLLMGYSGRDARILLNHGQRLHDAVKAHNPNVEMVVYNDEAHRWVLPKNKVDFWSRAEKFLDQHIGKK